MPTYSTWITVTLPGDYNNFHYENVYRVDIHPILKKHGFDKATGKCVSNKDLTESEYKLPSLDAARKCAKEINARLKQLKTMYPFLFDTPWPGMKLPSASVMRDYYERNGERNIVRPSTMYVDAIDTSLYVVKKFSATFELPKKYASRPSPPYPANDYCGRQMKGNDGKTYASIPNVRKVCRWQLVA